MTATDELRRLLNERGADYRVSATGYSIDIGPYTTAYANRSDTTLDVSLRQVTPAQAIAATLGAGTLTAKQVMAIAGRHQPDYCSDTHACFDWQAIADELNATLGSCNCSNNCTNGERTGTCHADETDTWECVCDQVGRYGKRVTIHVMECSECGRTYEHINGGYEYCPRCGRKVVDDG